MVIIEEVSPNFIVPVSFYAPSSTHSESSERRLHTLQISASSPGISVFGSQ
jgi:hypothetical protein